MSISHGIEITSLIQAHWNLRALRLTPAQQAALRGPRNDDQRLIELDLTLQSAAAVGQHLFHVGYDRGVIVIDEDGAHGWLVAFAQVPAALPGLPDAALETLDMARQIYSPADEAVVAMLMPERRVRLLYLARDGMRGQVYTRARPRATAQSAPTGLIGQATVSADGYVIQVRDPELGLVGRAALHTVDAEHMRLEGAVAGHPDDPMTMRRQALLEPVLAALERGLATVGRDREAARALVDGLLTPGRVRADVPLQVATRLAPCTFCAAPVAFLIFAEASDLTLGDYARMMYEVTRRHGLPAWVLRSGPVALGPAEGREVFPTWGAITQVTPDALARSIDALSAAHCPPRAGGRGARR